MKTYTLVLIALFATSSAVFQIFNNVVGIPTGFGMTVDLVAFPVLLAFFIFGFEAALHVSILMALMITIISPETWLGASMKFSATLPMILLPALWLLALKKKTDAGRIAAILVISLLLPLLLFMLSGIINLSSAAVHLESNQTLYSTPELSLGEQVFVEHRNVTTEMLVEGLFPILALALSAVMMLRIWRRYGGGIRMNSLAQPMNIVPVTLLAVFVRGIAMVIANFYYAGPLFLGMQPEQMLALSLPLEIPGVISGPALPLWFLILFWNAVQGAIEVAFAWTIAFKFRFAEYYGS